MSADQSPDQVIDQLADEPLDELDTSVLRAVRELHSRLDTVPSGLADRVKFELTLAALHAEIAELQALTPAGVRSEDSPFTPTESMTFTSSTMSLMVTISPATETGRPGTVRVDGWVTGGAAEVEIRVGEVSLHADVDDQGRFALEDVPHGAARFILRPSAPGERPVITPSVEI